MSELESAGTLPQRYFWTLLSIVVCVGGTVEPFFSDRPEKKEKVVLAQSFGNMDGRLLKQVASFFRGSSVMSMWMSSPAMCGLSDR